MGNMRFKKGDKVRIKSLDWYNKYKDEYGNIRYKRDDSAYPVFFSKYMSNFCGEILTIKSVFKYSYHMNETSSCEFWTDEMIEGLVEEETKPKLKVEPKFKIGNKVILNPYPCKITDVQWKDGYGFVYTVRGTDFSKTVKETDLVFDERTVPNTNEIIQLIKNDWNNFKDRYDIPDDYHFVDKNGNEINISEIVMEKKKKDVSLTQEQINKMVHDRCVLFCKYFGCGIPRDTCTSLGTCKEHDEYRDAIRAHLMEKKKGYPKTYEECCTVLGIGIHGHYALGYESDTLSIFQNLFICRNAYWKIAGDEMGLGKPWEPDYNEESYEQGSPIKYVIYYTGTYITKGQKCTPSYILTFPTEEMRDAFYENFKEEIEKCKELL